MFPASCHIICFSPTGSTRKIAESIASGMGLPVILSDITLPGARQHPIACLPEEVLLLAAPVYYGRVQEHAAKIFARLQGEGQPTVLLLNYGNRHYDDALREMCSLVKESGFCAVAAGAFVSEHSLSTSARPMAAGRPDASDLAQAVAFGTRIKEKLLRQDNSSPCAGLLDAGEFKPYPQLRRAPVTLESCTLCGVCIPLCPTGAIVAGEKKTETAAERCIACQACVRVCPEQAREDSAPGAKEVRERLAPLVAERKEPRVFL